MSNARFIEMEVASEVIDCIRSLTLEKFVEAHTVIVEMADENRYEIYARIIEDIGEPVYLYDIQHHHHSFSDDLRFGVGAMYVSSFHEFGDADKDLHPTPEVLQTIQLRMEPLRLWIEQNKHLLPIFSDRYKPQDKYLVETISEPFSLKIEHYAQ